MAVDEFTRMQGLLELQWKLESTRSMNRAWNEMETPSVLKLVHGLHAETFVIAPSPLPKIITVSWISPVHARIALAAQIAPQGGIPMKFLRIAYNIFAKLASQPSDENAELLHGLHPFIEGDTDARTTEKHHD